MYETQGDMGRFQGLSLFCVTYMEVRDVSKPFLCLRHLYIRVQQIQ